MLYSVLLILPALVAAAPGVKLETIRDIDWELELLGTRTPLERRARSEKSIDAIFKSLGKQYFGTAADRNLLNNAQNSEIIKADFGQITPENSGKWQTIEATQNNFNFNDLDFLVNWAQTNGKLVRGHTTVWHSQLPNWVDQINNKATLTSVIQNHVTKEIGRYAGKILQWDVVNEMFDESGGLRSSVFSRLLGEDFVRIAFEAARKADPAAKLYINDYNTVEKGASYKKTTGMATYVKKWIAAGIPIDGIGAQAHLVAGEAGNVAPSLRLLCAAAPECALTEVDIVQASANDYVNTIKACVDIANCVGVTVWGVRDPDSWRAASNPLLFNSGYSTKPAYGALVQTLGAMTATYKPTTTTVQSTAIVPTSTYVAPTTVIQVPSSATSVASTSVPIIACKS